MSTAPTKSSRRAGKTPKFHGLNRVDADHYLDIPIRRRHVSEAEPENPDRCILALAAKSMKGIKWARVGATFVYVVFEEEPETAYRYQIAERSVGITRLFDSNPAEFKRNPQLITNSTFTLRPPSPTMRLGYKNGSSGTSKRKTGKARSVHHAEPTRTMTFHADWSA